METERVKELREKYGIRDSRNEYTEEQIIELSQRKLYCIKPYRNDKTGTIHIEYKQVYGYISEDESACIFIKDSTITGDEHNYIPIKRIDCCRKIKEGIYHSQSDDVIYCTTNELQFCIDYEKKYVFNKIQKQITRLEQELLKLKNIKIVCDSI